MVRVKNARCNSGHKLLKKALLSHACSMWVQKPYHVPSIRSSSDQHRANIIYDKGLLWFFYGTITHKKAIVVLGSLPLWVWRFLISAKLISLKLKNSTSLRSGLGQFQFLNAPIG